MTSLQRSIVFPPSGLANASTLWRAAWFVLFVAGLLVVRACAYDFNAVMRYLAYVALYLGLPGAVTMYFVNHGPLSLTRLVALALPTGFAIEIFTFLGLSALHAKALYPWTPLVWAALAVAIRLRRGAWPVRVRVAGNHAGLCLALALAFLGTALIAASQMFAEAPLANGLPTRAIFHDWVYLVSRAAVIKNNWPLDDPSLSGTPLQYHYFMMVHAAATSWTTKIEISAVMLRLIFVPLGAILVAQSYALGRAVAHSPWGGVLAAMLTVMAGEVSLESSYGEPMFLGLFVRWLFVSPTFFFGLIFCGALLLAVAHCTRLTRCGVREYAWLLLLGTAGTGAKGTMLPVVLCALALWAIGRWVTERRIPTRVILFGLCLTAAFALVYYPTMSSWRTGDAAWRPFHVFQLTTFWKEFLPAWTAWFAQWLPAGLAATVASVTCAAVVFTGTCGVRIFALPFLLQGGLKTPDRQLVGWLGAFFLAAAGMGMLMELNSYGELYLILMIRLPMAVLTAAFFVASWRRAVAWWRALPVEAGMASAPPFAARASSAPIVALSGPASTRRWWSRALVGGVAALLAATMIAQTALWWRRNQSGFGEWLKTPTDLKPDGYMRELQEALLWVRSHTEPNAVLVSNACTPENMKKDHWGALDRTLTGVHFYYSALSERRLWFEGPNYIMDTTRARLRASMASNFFYRGLPLAPSAVSPGPSYILIDRSLSDGAKVALPPSHRVFSNPRMEIYRLSEAVGDGS